MKALEKLKAMKGQLTNNLMKEDMRHNYLYHILFDNFSSKEKLTQAKVDANRTPAIYNKGGCCPELR